MESKVEIEEFYKRPDPWGYQSNPDDIKRKEIILSSLVFKRKFKRAFDIGCGEGWITKDLPADKIYGYEISDNAIIRLPKNVKRVLNPTGKYDLIIATGVLYEHYDRERFEEIINNHASGIVLTCNIKSWEHNELPKEKQIFEVEFPYREYTEKLRIYDFST